jgi:cobaltochelatase CobN
VQAAILSRSSNLSGLLSTDHPFEYLGGLSLAVRHLEGASPDLYVADLRQVTPRITGAAGYLAMELRGRYLNPQWIAGMQREGYAGTLSIVNLANNLFGWQVVDVTMVRSDQWQAMHDTFIRDRRQLGLDAWFEEHNATAQAQVIARMAEAILKGYWDPDAQTRQELATRFAELSERHGTVAGPAETRQFLAMMGFGLLPAAQPGEAAPATPAESAAEPVRGQVMREATPAPSVQSNPLRWAAFGLAFLLLLAGALHQLLSLRREPEILSRDLA